MQVHKAKIRHKKLEMVELAECAFADDIIICAEYKKKPHQNLEWWNEGPTKCKVLINTSKIKTMVIGKQISK